MATKNKMTKKAKPGAEAAVPSEPQPQPVGVAETAPAEEKAATWVDIESLRGWDRNPKRHPDAQVAEMMASIRRFGWGSVILARTGGEIIAGHGRVEAARRLGMDRVPVRYLDLDPAEAHLLSLADNKIADHP